MGVKNGKLQRVIVSVSARERDVVRSRTVDTTDSETGWSYERRISGEHGVSGIAGLGANHGQNRTYSASGRQRDMHHQERDHEFVWSPFKVSGGIPINPGQTVAFDVPDSSPINYVNVLNADRTEHLWDNYSTVECRVTIG